MNDKKIHRLVACILGFIVVAHLFRAIALLNVTIEGFIVPIWASWIVVIVGSYFVWKLWKA